MTTYDLKGNQPGRRAGLRKADYAGPSLLKTIKDAPKHIGGGMTQESDLCRPTAEARLQSDEEDITRPPNSSSDEEEDESKSPVQSRADIKPTTFGKRESTRTKNTDDRNGTKNGSSKMRLARKVSPISSGPKRKSVEPSTEIGLQMKNVFGFVTTQHKKTRRLNNYSSSNAPQFKKPDVVRADSEDSPKRKVFKAPGLLTPQKQDELKRPKFKKPANESPSSTPSPAKTFVQRNLPSSPIAEPDEEAPCFRKLKFDLSTNKNVMPLDSSTPNLRSKVRQTDLDNDILAVQKPSFKTYELDRELVESAQALMDTHRDLLLHAKANILEGNDDSTMNAQARCPMCTEPVDPEDLEAHGEMNTRMQERFCRAHQKKTAKASWTSKGYPQIDWDNLDSRISKHYPFIKKLLNGAESHYRQILNQTVKDGKDRTLLKMTSNLTPGYYGSRGLRAISENIMNHFSSVLRKMVVKDKLMAARGVTGFVQSVLVPEICSLLIMEDMRVEIAEARSILTESVGIGELVNEEITDVLSVVDTDEED